MVYFHYSLQKNKVRYAGAIKKWLTNVAKAEHKKISRIDYFFVSDAELLAINQSQLGHDYYTDILTFPYAYQPIQSEIYISMDRINDQANIYKVSRRDELHRVMVHGLLHLCGYDDRSKAKKQIMTGKEDYYLLKRKF
jgi:probable rRNA maturation factor